MRRRTGAVPSPQVPRLVVDGVDVAQVVVADTFATRLRGLAARRRLPESLLLSPSNSVHGVGMLVRLDVALLDAAGTVVDVLLLRPFGMTWPRRGVTGVLEAPAGSFARWGLSAGSTVAVRRSPQDEAARR